MSLSSPEEREVQAFADANGLNFEDAATELARLALNQRFKRWTPAPATVIPIRKVPTK